MIGQAQTCFMLRLLDGITVRVGVRPTLCSSHSLISHSTSRSIHTSPGYLAITWKTRRDMAKVVPHTRPLSEVDPEPNQVMTSAEKKPRLEVEVEPTGKTPIASTSTRPTTTKQEQTNGKTRSKKKPAKKRKHRNLPPEPYSHEDVLWRDVRDLLGVDVADRIIEEGNEWQSPFQPWEELEVEVSAISSTGAPLHLYFSCGNRLNSSFSR